VPILEALTVVLEAVRFFAVAAARRRQAHPVVTNTVWRRR